MQNLETQLNALVDFRGFLGHFLEEISDIKNRYVGKVNSLREAGVSIQTVETYDGNFNQNLVMFNHLLDNISGYDLPYIEKNIESIRDAIDKARMG